MKKIELLAPAGNLERLKVAFAYGADAVYIGGQKYSLRARASNFTIKDIEEAVKIAKSYHGKVYVTCNIIAHNEDLTDLQDLKNYLNNLEKAGVTGVIASDLAIIDTVRENNPNLELHISTQLSTMNSEVFRRDEIWFAEKEKDNTTSLYTLEKFKIRYDKVVSKNYLAGRYGAVPVFKDFEYVWEQ